jgi:hypothetical protein
MGPWLAGPQPQLAHQVCGQATNLTLAPPCRIGMPQVGIRPPWARRTASLLRTVNTRLRDVSAKLGVANRVALAAVVDHPIE